MQIGDDELERAARGRERASALASPYWVNCNKGRQGFVGRLLCIWQMPPPHEGGSLEQRMSKGKLRIDLYRAVQDGSWDWVPYMGWQTPVAPPRDAARSRSPAPLRAAAARAKAEPRAAPKASPRAPKPSWSHVTNAFPQKYQLRRGGRTYYHARTVIQRMGLQTWCAHLADKIPTCQKEFGWPDGTEFVRDQGGLPGVAPYWLTLSAAKQVYDKFAM